MSSSWRDVPSGPYRSDREKKFEEARRSRLAAKARAESDVLRKIEHDRAELRATGKVLHILLYMADSMLSELEQERDKCAPGSKDDDFSDAFCCAVEKIADMRILCNNLWFAWCNIDRPGFSPWI